MSRTQNLSFSQLRVGLFVLFGLLVLGFLILNSTGDFNPFAKKLRLKARFTQADGLREGSEVQLAGVHIGKVERVTLLPPDSPEDEKIEAIMAVDRELNNRPITERIRTDSTAQLVATSLLANDKMINITPGTQKGSSVNENHVLNSTAAISINQLTQTGNDLLQQIDKIAGPANDILQKASNGDGTIGQMINNDDMYQNLNAAVNEMKLTMVKLQTTMDKVNNGDGTAAKMLNDPALYRSLNETVGQLEALTKDIRAGKGTAGKFVSDDAFYNETKLAISELRTMTQKLTGLTDDLKVITGDLKDGKGTAGKFLKDEAIYDETRAMLSKFNSTAGKLDSMLTDFEAGKGTVGKMLKDETLYNNINQTMSNVNQLSSEGTKLMYDFRQNPRKFLTIKFKLF